MKSPRNMTPVKERDKSHCENEPYIVTTPTTPNLDESFFANISRTFSRTNSRRSKTPSPSPRSLSRNSSRRSTTPTLLSRDQSRRSNSDSEFLRGSISRNLSRKVDGPESNETPISPELNSTADRLLSRNTSRRSPKSTPIIYSQSTALKKPLPVEKKLECTLEELCDGCVKKIMITRDAIVNGSVTILHYKILDLFF